MALRSLISRALCTTPTAAPLSHFQTLVDKYRGDQFKSDLHQQQYGDALTPQEKTRQCKLERRVMHAIIAPTLIALPLGLFLDGYSFVFECILPLSAAPATMCFVCLGDVYRNNRQLRAISTALASKNSKNSNAVM